MLNGFTLLDFSSIFISFSYTIPSTISDVPLIYIPTLFNYTNDVITNNGTSPITLNYYNPSTSYVILDYEYNVGGFLFFDIDQK